MKQHMDLVWILIWTFIKRCFWAQARWLGWLEHHPVHQKVARLIPGAGAYGIDVFLSHRCFSLSLKINKHVLRWRLKKKKYFWDYEGNLNVDWIFDCILKLLIGVLKMLGFYSLRHNPYLLVIYISHIY